MEVREIATMADYESALNESGVVVLKAGATWCHPCKMLAETMHKMEEIDGAHLYEFDIESDAGLELCEKYSIMSVPVLLVFKNKELVDKSIGSITKERLADIIASHQ